MKSSYLQLFNSPEALKYLSYMGKPFDEPVVTNWLRNHVVDGVDYYISSEEPGKIDGIAVAKSSPATGFELLALVVQENRRRKGLGKKLVAHVVDAARHEGFRAVDVTVFADNRPMLLLVIGLGFLPVRMTARMRHDGMDVVHLKRYLE